MNEPNRTNHVAHSGGNRTVLSPSKTDINSQSYNNYDNFHVNNNQTTSAPSQGQNGLIDKVINNIESNPIHINSIHHNHPILSNVSAQTNVSNQPFDYSLISKEIIQSVQKEKKTEKKKNSKKNNNNVDRRKAPAFIPVPEEINNIFQQHTVNQEPDRTPLTMKIRSSNGKMTLEQCNSAMIILTELINKTKELELIHNNNYYVQYSETENPNFFLLKFSMPINYNISSNHLIEGLALQANQQLDQCEFIVSSSSNFKDPVILYTSLPSLILPSEIPSIITNLYSDFGEIIYQTQPPQITGGQLIKADTYIGIFVLINLSSGMIPKMNTVYNHGNYKHNIKTEINSSLRYCNYCRSIGHHVMQCPVRSKCSHCKENHKFIHCPSADNAARAEGFNILPQKYFQDLYARKDLDSYYDEEFQQTLPSLIIQEYEDLQQQDLIHHPFYESEMVNDKLDITTEQQPDVNLRTHNNVINNITHAETSNNPHRALDHSMVQIPSSTFTTPSQSFDGLQDWGEGGPSDDIGMNMQ